MGKKETDLEYLKPFAVLVQDTRRGQMYRFRRDEKHVRRVKRHLITLRHSVLMGMLGIGRVNGIVMALIILMDLRKV